jgi:hypothetical protein
MAGLLLGELVSETDRSEATTLGNYLLTKLYTDRGVGGDYNIDSGPNYRL